MKTVAARMFLSCVAICLCAGLPAAAAGLSAEELWIAGDFAAAWEAAEGTESVTAQLLAARAATDHAVHVLAPGGASFAEQTGWLERAILAAEQALSLGAEADEAAAAWLALARANGEQARQALNLSSLAVAGELKGMFERALALAPDDPDVLAGLAMWHLELVQRGVGWLYGGQRSQVEPLLQRSIGLAPARINLRVEYATALLALDQAERAREQLEIVLQLEAVNAVEQFEQERARAMLQSIQ
jgi:hypothetical protein